MRARAEEAEAELRRKDEALVRAQERSRSAAESQNAVLERLRSAEEEKSSRSDTREQLKVRAAGRPKRGARLTVLCCGCCAFPAPLVPRSERLARRR